MTVEELNQIYRENLKALRSQAGLSQAALSEAAAITDKFYNDIETGRKYLKGLKYKDEAIDDIMRQVLPLRIDRERKDAKRREAQALIQREKASSYIEIGRAHV